MSQPKGYVLVTGGSRGIGRAIVLRMAREGYYVVFTYHTRREQAEETLRQVKSLGSDGFYLQMDVASEESVARAARIVAERIPYLNVLVNNAGIFQLGGIKETSLEEWEKVIRVNLTGVFLVTKYFLPLLEKAPWAAIVNIASLAGQTAGVAGIAYSAAKGGVIAFTRRLAAELAPKIRVNAVAPSFVETDMVKCFIDTPEKRKRVEELHPLKTIGKPEDVAEAVAFLADPVRARFITGEVLNLNGGRFMC